MFGVIHEFLTYLERWCFLIGNNLLTAEMGESWGGGLGLFFPQKPGFEVAGLLGKQSGRRCACAYRAGEPFEPMDKQTETAIFAPFRGARLDRLSLGWAGR